MVSSMVIFYRMLCCYQIENHTSCTAVLVFRTAVVEVGDLVLTRFILPQTVDVQTSFLTITLPETPAFHFEIPNLSDIVKSSPSINRPGNGFVIIVRVRTISASLLSLLSAVCFLNGFTSCSVGGRWTRVQSRLTGAK